MSLIKQGEVAMNDTTSVSVFCNSEEQTLEFIQGEDSVVAVIELTPEQYDSLKGLIDEV